MVSSLLLQVSGIRELTQKKWFDSRRFQFQAKLTTGQTRSYFERSRSSQSWFFRFGQTAFTKAFEIGRVLWRIGGWAWFQQALDQP